MAFLGCTNILMTCSHIWREAVELLHQHEAVFYLDGHFQHVLRGPREFGKLGYFGDASWDWPRLGARRFQFNELQFIRLRKVVLRISFPARDRNFALRDRSERTLRGHTRLTRARDKVKEMALAMGKSHTLETVRIIVRTDEDNSYKYNLLPAGRRGARTATNPRYLMPLIDAARRANITLIFDQYFDDKVPGARCDPFTIWTHGAAVNTAVSTQLIHTNPSPLDEDCDINKDQNSNTADVPTVLEKDMITPLLTANKYELVPECRTCYETFREWSELAAHLTKQPKHKKSFVKKPFNKLHPAAVREASGLPMRCNIVPDPSNIGDSCPATSKHAITSL